jgi:hypothetical protein
MRTGPPEFSHRPAPEAGHRRVSSPRPPIRAHFHPMATEEPLVRGRGEAKRHLAHRRFFTRLRVPATCMPLKASAKGHGLNGHRSPIGPSDAIFTHKIYQFSAYR